MLDHIDTGYEDRFDFPLRTEPPELTYLLATMPRAGSTYFSHVLWRTGCLGAPLEYLNFLPASPYGFAAGSPRAQQELWRSLLHRRCSPNGVFGLKAFPAQLQELDGSNPALLRDVLATIVPRDRVRRVVFLRRRNKVAQAVSFARAAMTGIWRKEQEGINQAPPDYSQHLVKSAEREIAVQENAWSHMFRDLRIEPLSVWHEDVLADPTEAAQQVADYLGVTIDPASSLKVPEIRKQSQGDSQSWIDQFSRSRGA